MVLTMRLVNVEYFYCADCEWKDNCENVKCDVKDMPVVDAVPVVRCADCIYLVNATYGQYCNNSHGLKTVFHDTYCPYGKAEPAIQREAPGSNPGV